MAMVMENQQPLAPMPAPPLPPPPPPPLPPPPFKHRCKVCKKGFTCGRALGGHMRAHGVADDDALSGDSDALDGDDDDDDDDAVPCVGGGAAWDSASSAAATTKRSMYSLRTNAGRHKNCRACENCGKEFTSSKSLLDHGRCNVDQAKADDLNIDVDDEDDEEDLALAAGGWSKGKRTRRTKVIVVENGSPTDDQQLPATSREEEDLANFLVMLSSSRCRGAGVHQPPQAIADARQQAHASTSKQAERAPPARRKDHEQRFLAPPPQPISMLPPTVPQFKFLAPPQVVPSSPAVPRGLFECKACKKVFTSHQALGGHRASHKKVKGCFAARNDQPSAAPPASNDNVKVVVEAIPAVGTVVVDANTEVSMINARTTAAVAAANSAPEMAFMQVVDEAAAASSSSTVPQCNKKGKVHECSICHRVFMSGQALGGHKRCHWLTTGAAAGDPAAVARLPFVAPEHVMHAAMCQQLTLGPAAMFGASDSCLDLNVPTMNESGDHPGMLSLNAAPAASSLYMHSWAGHTNMMQNTAATSGHYDDLPEGAASDDEADSTSTKRAKMSDLKDMNMSGETSPWLQVGIALPSSDTTERLLKPKG